MKTHRLGPRDYRVEVGTTQITAHIDRLGLYECWLTAFGRRYHVVSVTDGVHSRMRARCSGLGRHK